MSKDRRGKDKREQGEKGEESEAEGRSGKKRREEERREITGAFYFLRVHESLFCIVASYAIFI